MKKKLKPIPSEVNAVSREIVDAAYKIHVALGPGLLEHVYEMFLVHELERRGRKVQRQVSFNLSMDGFEVDSALRIDLLVDEKVIVELKAVEKVLPVHHAQVLSYLKLTGKPLGLLINFNVVLLKEGIKRFVL